MTDQVEREVERRDRRHDATRHAQCESELFASRGIRVQRNGLAVEALRFLRRSHYRFNRPARLASPFGDDFPLFFGNQLAQLFVARGHRIRGFAQNLPALVA